MMSMQARSRVRGHMLALASCMALGIAGLAFAPAADAQIASTKHNLGSTGTGTNKFDGTAEICVFCHTPHGADTSAAAPLWNRKISGTTYQTYDALGTSTLDGKTAPVGSVSIACLSCHDGTQAMNTVINAPGSGNYNVAGFTMAGTWTGANVETSGVNAGKLKAGIISNIGTDLRNDHPIGIQYGGGGYSAGSLTGPSTDPDFRTAATAVLGSQQAWWVDTAGGTTGTRQKTDMVLYTRSSADGYTGQTQLEPFVECASCHDPHTSNPTFLRISNDGSAVCLACHIK